MVVGFGTVTVLKRSLVLVSVVVISVSVVLGNDVSSEAGQSMGTHSRERVLLEIVGLISTFRSLLAKPG